MASTWQEAEKLKLKNWIPPGEGHGIGIQNGKRQAFRFGKPVPNWTVPIQDLLIENPVGVAKGAYNLAGKTLETVLGLPSQKDIERATRIRNNRLAQSNETKVHPWQGTMPNVDFTQLAKDTKGRSLDQSMVAANIPGANKGWLTNLLGSRLDFGGEEARKHSEELNVMLGHKPSDNDNKTKLLKETESKVIKGQGGQPFGSTAPRREIPNTVESSDSRDPIKLPEVEKGGTRWVGVNSTWKSGRTGQVIAPNIKDLPQNQVPSVLRDNGSVSSIKEFSKAQKKLASNPGFFQSLKIKGSELLDQGKETVANVIASLPKSEQLTKLKAFDGTNAGLVKGMKGIGAIASALQAVFNKKKKPSTAGMEDKGRGIDQVLVASGNNNTEDFYDSLFG